MKKLFLLFVFAFFATPVYANNKDSKVSDLEISKIVDFTKGTITEVINVMNYSSASDRYLGILKLIEDDFDYKNVAEFGFFAKNYKKLNEEQKEYLDQYTKRSICLMFMERFSVKSIFYDVQKVVKAKREGSNSYNVFIKVKNVDGLQIDELLKNISPEDSLVDTEVVFVVKKDGGKYVFSDVKTMNMSFLIKSRESYQEALKKNENDLILAIDDLLASLNKSEIYFQNRNKIDQSLFPSIKNLVEL